MEILTFRSRTTDPAQRGFELGRAHSRAITQTVATYLRYFRTLGISSSSVDRIAAESGDCIREHMPSLEQELRALAAAIDVTFSDVCALAARTEILSQLRTFADGECSTSAYIPDQGAPRSIQTWDWRLAVAEYGLFSRHCVSPSRSVASFSEPGMPAKFGMNSSGIAVHMNLLNHAEDASAPGLPVHALQRKVLDEATTIDEVRAIVSSVPLAGSCTITVLQHNADGSDAACFELCPAGIAELPADDGYISHSNHFLDPTLANGERADLIGSTVPRLQCVRRGRPALGSEDFATRAAGLCAGEGNASPVCMKPDPRLEPLLRSETLLTLGFDMDDLAIIFQVGPPPHVIESGTRRFPLEERAGHAG